MNSEKNARIISFALIVVMLLAFYFIPYKKLDAKKLQLTNEVNSLTSTYNVLKIDVDKKDDYLKDIEESKAKIKNIDENLPSELSQELLIYTINDMEKTLGIQMPSVNFGLVETVSQLYEEKDESGNQASQTTTDGSTATNQATNEQTTTDQSTDQSNSNQTTNNKENKNQETAIKRMITTTTTLNYAQLKSLMSYLYSEEGLNQYASGVYSNRKWISLNGLTLASNPETGDITAGFSLSFYGLESKDNKDKAIDLGTFDIGKKGVFLPFSEFGIKFTLPESTSNTNNQSISDFFIMLSPITADQTTVTMGKASGMSSTSFVYADSNSFVDVTLELSQEGDTYYYKYSAGNEKFPSQGVIAFIPGNSLDLLVMSNKRNGSDDKSGANVTIINNTDLTLNITNTGDDKSSPRFKVVKTVGKVSGN